MAHYIDNRKPWQRELVSVRINHQLPNLQGLFMSKLFGNETKYSKIDRKQNTLVLTSSVNFLEMKQNTVKLIGNSVGLMAHKYSP